MEYFLAHITYQRNLDTIINKNALKPDISERYTDGCYLEGTQGTCEGEGGQFPGVFMMIIPDNFKAQQWMDEEMSIILFPIKLLEQNNYHINLVDQMGLINSLTIFPWTVHDNFNIIKEISKHENNEVVFHDDVNMDLACGFSNYPFNDIKNIKCTKRVSIDTKTKPFYYFKFFPEYAVGNFKYYYSDFPSRKDFYYNLCGLVKNKEDCETAESLEELNEIMFNEEYPWKYYYRNRDLQNLNRFKLQHFFSVLRDC